MIRGNASHVQILDVQAVLIRPIVHLVRWHITGAKNVNMTVLHVLTVVTETKVALPDIVTTGITTLTIQVRKGMNAFDVPATVLLV